MDEVLEATSAVVTQSQQSGKSHNLYGKEIFHGKKTQNVKRILQLKSFLMINHLSPMNYQQPLKSEHFSQK